MPKAKPDAAAGMNSPRMPKAKPDAVAGMNSPRMPKAKPNAAAGMNDLPPPMKNERPKPNNPTETRTIQSRTQIAVQNSELGSNESTGHKLTKSL